jgi:outer membrane receptor protein involved in Fe transport
VLRRLAALGRAAVAVRVLRDRRGTAAATERWHTYNVRDVDTAGVELSVRRMLKAGAFVQAGYTGLSVDTPGVTLTSKYVLDYSPHALVAAALAPLGAGIHAAPRLEVRQRRRSVGTSRYALLDVRLSRRLGAIYELAVDAANLLDAGYEEVLGVRMPGRAVTASLTVGRR